MENLSSGFGHGPLSWVSFWPGAAAVMAHGGDILAANEAFYRRAGYRPDQQSIPTILGDEQSGLLAKGRSLYLARGPGGQDWQLSALPGTEWIFCHAPGQAASAASAPPIPTAAPPVPVGEDQWQHQKLQALGQLAGGVAHDFNNILTATLGHCDLLLERVGPGDDLFSDIIQIRHNSQRAAGLVKQLLAFSRQQTLTPQPVAVQPLSLELLHLLRRLVGEQIVVDLVWADTLPMVLADAGQLEQMIVNLVVNARDALSETGTGAGKIILRLSRQVTTLARPLRPGDHLPPGDYLVVSVEDNGPGIDPAVQNRLFEPFFTTKPVGQGTGLGLAMVHGAIRQMQGYVDLDSRPGEGSRFSLWLPVLAADAAQTMVRADVTTALSPLALAAQGEEVVLLVEDEDPVRRIAARTLRHKGYMVIEAATGEDALAVLADRHQRIDLFVSDVILPDMEAPALVSHLRQGRHDVPVLLMSGYAAESVRDQIGTIGAVSFLPKPFSLQDFIQAVRQCLDDRSATLLAG